MGSNIRHERVDRYGARLPFALARSAASAPDVAAARPSTRSKRLTPALATSRPAEPYVVEIHDQDLDCA